MPSLQAIGGSIAVSILVAALLYGCHHDEAKKAAPVPPAPVQIPKYTPPAEPSFHCRIFHCAPAPLPKARPVAPVAPKAVVKPPLDIRSAAQKATPAPAPAAPVDFCTQVRLVEAEHGKAWTEARAKELNYTEVQQAAVEKCMN
jgi:hypothetical protein